MASLGTIQKLPPVWKLPPVSLETAAICIQKVTLV